MGDDYISYMDIYMTENRYIQIIFFLKTMIKIKLVEKGKL